MRGARACVSLLDVLSPLHALCTCRYDDVEYLNSLGESEVIRLLVQDMAFTTDEAHMFALELAKAR